MQIINGFGELLYRQPRVCMTNLENIGVTGATIASFGFTHAAWQDPARENVVMNLGLKLRDPFYDAGLEPPGTRMQLGETIREWIPATGEQKILTKAFELIDPITYRSSLSDNAYGPLVNCNGTPPGPENQNWTHANAISRLNNESNWIISQRNTSSALILEPSTFKLLMKFGSIEPSDLRFESPYDMFYVQHDIHELKDGNILIFDDGIDRPISQGEPYARAIEYHIDMKRKTLVKTWEFRPEKDLKCNNNGSARRLKNGHNIVDFGATNLEACQSVNKAIADLAVSSKMAEAQFTIYRAIPIESIFGEIRINC